MCEYLEHLHLVCKFFPVWKVSCIFFMEQHSCKMGSDLIHLFQEQEELYTFQETTVSLKKENNKNFFSCDVGK